MFRALPSILAASDPDAWLSHDTEWTISVSQSRLVVWEDVEHDDKPRHLLNVSREKIEELWRRLAAGDLAAIERENWRSGYGGDEH